MIDDRVTKKQLGEDLAIAGLASTDSINSTLQRLVDEARDLGYNERLVASCLLATLGTAVEEWIALIAGPEPSPGSVGFASGLAGEFVKGLQGVDWSKAIYTHCAPEGS